MNNSPELSQYIAVIVKWWWALCLATIVGAGIGYKFAQLVPPGYEATTTVIVGPSLKATNLSTGDIQISDRLAFTYVELVRREPVLQGTINALNLKENWQELKQQVRASLVQQTQLLEITADAPTAEEAWMIADEVAHQLILLSPTALQDQEENKHQDFVHYQLENLQAKIEAGHKQRNALEKTMTDTLSADQVTKLQNEINTLEKLISDWENNYTQLLIITERKNSPNYLAIVESAQGNWKKAQPGTLIAVVLAGIIGFMLVLGLVCLREFLDDTVKSTDDLSRSMGLDVLGVIGRIKGKRFSDKLIAEHNPLSPITESYRMIRSSIQLMSTERQAKFIMITSPGPAEGKSITVANLGIVMAQAGLKTIIVDSNLRWPAQHEIFQLANKGGLTELLNSPVLKVESCLRATGIKNLQVLTSGEIVPDSLELLASEGMKQLLIKLNELADVIICDSPPALFIADVTVLANQMDGVVLVTEARQTQRQLAKQTVTKLQQAEVNILGGVLNLAPNKQRGSYYYRSNIPSKPAPVVQSVQPRPKRRWQWLAFFK